jgi:hypothetical protein
MLTGAIPQNSDQVKTAIIAEQPVLLEGESEAQERVLRALIRGETDGVTFLIRDASSEVAQLVEGHGFHVTQDSKDTKAIIVDDLERSR